MTSPSSRPLVSIVTPVYNEEANVVRAYETTIAALAPVADRYDFEFVFTDNHSTDRTFEILAELARKAPRVRVFRFAKNFGYQKSIYYGYLQARGAAAVQLDADLEDPPAMILTFLKHWEEGCRVVYGIRIKRQEAWLLSRVRDVFYWVIDKLSDDHLPQGAGDFRLLDRLILDELAKIHDPNIYIRGRVAAMGYRQLGIPYTRDPRIAGVSKFSIGGLFHLALDGITSHSTTPLRFASYVGFASTALAFLLGAGYAVARLFFHADWPPGFATVTILLFLATGLNCSFLGILGEYIAKIHSQLKIEHLPLVEHVVDATPKA